MRLRSATYAFNISRVLFWQFDEALRETFEMYATFRASGSIGPMRVFQVARGTFNRLKQRATSAAPWLTSSAGVCSHPQYKTPRVMRDPAYVELLASSTVGLWSLMRDRNLLVKFESGCGGSQEIDPTSLNAAEKQTLVVAVVRCVDIFFRNCCMC